MEIDEVADALYVLPPEVFTVARRTAAGLDPSKKKAITALRRPTVAAWVVNTLVRRDPLALEELLAIGPALADAQARGDGDEVRALSQQRRALLPEVASRAVELAGRSVSDAVLLEVESTLDAGLVDPASADAVRSGRLVRALSFAGFGGVDLAGATAVPTSPTATGKATGKTSTGGTSASKTSAGKASAGKATAGKANTGKATGEDDAPAAPGPSAAERRARAELERLEADALDAAGRLDDAVRALDSADAAHAAAAADLRVADEEVARAEEALGQARQRRTDVQALERRATSARTEAERAVSRAQARAERARLALDARRRG